MQLAAARADQAAARAAVADAAQGADAILHRAEQDKQGTDAYVDELRKQNEALAASGKPSVCGLTCNDLRGMRIKSAACATPAAAPDSRIFAPIRVPSASLNDDARARLAQTHDALKEANGRLEAVRAWYDGVRQS